MSTTNSNSVHTVAFIGVGNMGAPMARNARAAGFELTVCDRNAAALQSFAALDVRTTPDAGDCAAADAIVVLLANDQQVRDCLVGPDGVAARIQAPHRPIVCMMGTTLPDTLQAVRGPLEAAGARLIDAPVSGGIVGAQRGTLSIMAGGDAANVTAVTPLLRSMGQRLFHCGPLGAGEVVKVINNMLCIANMFLTAEAIELGERHGVSFEKLTPILSVSTGLNFLTADAATGRAQYAAWARSAEAYRAIHAVVGKDLHLALRLAELGGIEPGLLKRVSAYVDRDEPAAMQRWMASGQVR